MHLAYIWIVSHLSAKNYRNWWKFDEVLTKTNLLSFFWDTVYNVFGGTLNLAQSISLSPSTVKMLAGSVECGGFVLAVCIDACDMSAVCQWFV